MYCKCHFMGFCVLELLLQIEYVFRKNQSHKLNSLCAPNPASFNLRVVGVEEDKDTTDTFSGIALRVLFMVCLNTATV